MKVIKYNAEKKCFYSSGCCPHPENDNSPLGTCVRALNHCIQNFSDAFEYGNLEEKLVQYINSGISAIDKNKLYFDLNKQNIQELKEEFTKIMKKIFIQKIYEIDDKEIGPKYDKFFRKDEKRLKRIKIFGSHLFSTKATLKGKINALFREFVNSDVPNDNHERQFNALFSQLKQHKENKQKQREINNYDDKSIGLNTAFDNGHNNII